ncbi:MAG: glycosyltransferase family 4 protein [Rhodothermaceae bacterium]|nr:glycosyltransferase family 4 protein [Rhodothermaceae bacterium]
MYSNVRVLHPPHYQEEPGSSDAVVQPLPNHVSTAIVHDWLPVYAGAERVLEQMIHVLPESELFSLIDFLPPDQRDFLQGKSVNTSFIQKLPLARSKYRFYLPFVPFATEQFNLTSHDIVVSSSYVAAKGVLTTANQLHISYVHSPIRYAWDLHFQYLKEGGLEKGLKGLMAKLILHYVRLFDVSTSNRVDHYVANSKTVARRIWKTYRRQAEVIYPPVDTSAFTLCEDKEDFYLTASRLVPYKKIDLLVEAFRDMPDKQLVVIGDGPDYDKIVARATPNIKMLGHVPFEDLKNYMQHAKAFLFAAEEDFGIVPVEAQACGTPVVAFGKGGATETVIPGETGLFFYEQTEASVQAAIEQLERVYPQLSHSRIRENALRFSGERFKTEFQHMVSRVYNDFMSSDSN